MLAVIGSSKSGKTSIVAYLISKLTGKGFKVGSAKHVHHRGFTIDAAEKDTWRHARAGAKRVVCISEDEVAVIRKQRGDSYGLEDISKLFRDEDFDLVILEGFRRLVSDRTDIAKILTAKDEEDAERLLKLTKPPIIAATGRICTKRSEPIRGIPIIDMKKEGAQLVSTLVERMRLRTRH